MIHMFRITAGENMTIDSATPRRGLVNGRLAAAAPLRSPRSAGGVIRCVCENNVERDMMVQCEVNTHLLPCHDRLIQVIIATLPNVNKTVIHV